MNTKIFIRYETAEGHGWANAIETLSTDIDSTPYAQNVQRYSRADYRMQVFKTYGEHPSTYLSIGIPLDVNNQSVTISPINMNAILSKLATNNYYSVFYAFYFNGSSAGDLDVITKSDYYARNKLTGNFENLTTGEAITDPTPKFSFWYSVAKMGNSKIYHMIVNPELVTITRDLDGTFDNFDYRLLGTQDGSFAEAVFNPTVSGGTSLSNNIIVADSNTVTIDTFGNSAIHGFTGSKIPANEMPNIQLDVTASVPYTINNNIVTVDVSAKNISYVKIKWVTGSNLDFSYISKTESPTQEFAIIK